jgi:hypothetical protein
MPEYMLSVHHSAADPAEEWTQEEMERAFADVEAFNQKLRAEGAWVFAGGLMPRETATTVDNTGDAPVLTDGPFAETKEWLGGFWVIEAPDLDAALRWAEAGSKACAGKVEVRPFQGE